MRSRVAVALALVAVICAVPAGAQEGELSFNTGLNHLKDGRVKLAIESFRDAVDKDDQNPYFFKGLGLAYMRGGQLEEAIDAFEKALDINPYYVDVHNDLGTALVLRGKRDEGKEHFLLAFNHPQNPTPELSARNLGQALLEEGQPDQALNWFRTSLARNDRYADAYVGLSDALTQLGRSDDAVVQLELGHERLPDDASVSLALGEAYFESGRFSDARKLFEHVASADPAGPLGRRALERLRTFPQ